MLEIVPAADPALAAAQRLAQAIAQIDARRGACRLAIPGGSALQVLRHVQGFLPTGTWSRVHLTWVDERCVPLADPASNRGALHRMKLPPPGLELPLWTDEDGNANAALERFERGFSRGFAGGLDVALLGLGEDGHVASLFPAHPALQATGAAVFVPDSPKPPPLRMSLTLAVLRATPLAIMLVTGEGKRAALLRVIQREAGLPTSSLPHLRITTDIELESEDDE
jgi:6-phosphogluconolactonase